MSEEKVASESEANVSEFDLGKSRADSASVSTLKKGAATKTAAAKKPATKSAATKKAVTKSAKSKMASAVAKAKRSFPKSGLEECVKLVNAIKEFNAGNPCAPREIAKVLGVGLGNNYFYLTAACRDYGLTVGTRDTAKIELTDLGRSLAYPKSPSMHWEALNSAFRNISLFQKVYDYYQGGVLPEIQYLKNTLKTEFGVEEQFQDDFYQLFQKNVAYLRTATGSSPAVGRGPTTGNTSTSSSGDSIILGESNNSGKLVAFVAMPFSEKTGRYEQGYFDEVLKHLITPAAVKAHFNARTAKKAGSEVIQSTIVNDLDSADLVIVDLTEHNPNVLFELGMRIAFNKPVCLIRAKGTPAIFDIDHMLRVFDYNPNIWPSTLALDIGH